ncbi:MAG: hypothetical protein ACR2RV_01405 [Verrucomicrobiales bacterium]
MKRSSNFPLSLAVSGMVSLTLISMAGAQVIIDDDFDAAEVDGWIGQGNIRAFSEQSLSQAESVLTSEVVATETNTNRGIVSESSFEPSATGGFSLTFAVDNVGGQPGANGYFIGLVRDNDQFFRDATTKNFGLAFFGQDARTGSLGGFGLIYGDNNATASSDFQLANSDAEGDVDINSFLDGFTATVSVGPDGWAYEITGLMDAVLTEKVFMGAGTWADAGTDFETLFPAGDAWFVMGSLQVVAATTYSIGFDRITLAGGSGGGGSSVFQILSVAYDGDEVDPTATLTWTSLPNRSYSVDVSTDLGGWSEITDGVESGGETTEFAHRFMEAYPELIGAPRVHYRVREE